MRKLSRLLRGIVADEAGKPVSGVKLQSLTFKKEDQRQTESLRNGAFVLRIPAEGRYGQSILATDSSGELTGIVRDDQGEILPDAEIHGESIASPEHAGFTAHDDRRRFTIITHGRVNASMRRRVFPVTRVATVCKTRVTQLLRDWQLHDLVKQGRTRVLG